MPLFARVFVTVLDSSIAEDFTLRHVFEDLFKLCDWKTGVVDMTRQAISRRLNIPLKTLNDCIDKLESPDSASRDPDNEGRRLQRLDDHRDWGWRILNWQKYDAIRNRADVAQRVAKHRDREKSSNELARAARGQGAPVAVDSRPPDPDVPPPLTRVRGTNRPASVEQAIEAGKMLGLSEVASRKFWNHYESTSRHDENGKPVWVTGEKGEKQVGNWRNLQSSWKSRDDERRNQQTQKPQKESEREPGPAVILPVHTFNHTPSAPQATP